MALIAGRCTQCGGLLEIDATGSMFVCPYCHTPFVVEKVVNYYNYTRNVDDWVRSADAFLELKEFSEAEREFERIAREHAYDYRGWWGLVKSKSRVFTDYDISKSELDSIESLYAKTNHFATNDVKNNIQHAYNYYVNIVRYTLQKLKEDTSAKLKHLEVEYERNTMPLENQIKQMEKEENSKKKISSRIKWIVFVIAIIISFNVFSNGETVYMVQIIVSSAVGYGIGKILESSYIKQVDALRKEINSLKCRLNEMGKEYRTKRIPLDELMQKVGNI